MPVKLPLLLTPGSKEATRLIVANSAARLLNSFTSMVDYLFDKGVLEPHEERMISESMEAMKKRDPEMVFRMFSSPIFRGWYSRFGRIKDLERRSPALERLMSSWNNHLFSLDYEDNFRCTFSVENGYCVFWNPEIVIACSQFDTLTIEKNAGVARICSPGRGRLLASLERIAGGPRWQLTSCTEELSVWFPRGYLPGTRIPVRNDIPELRLKLSGWERESAVNGDLDLTPNAYDPQFGLDEFVAAAELIRAAWPEEYADFSETLHIVVPRNVPPGWRARGMTVSSYQGAIWLMARGLLPIFENLLHEQSHVKLRYIEEQSPLLQDNQAVERYKVGWRSDPRPIAGIFEGIYVPPSHASGINGLASVKTERSRYKLDP